MKRLLLAAAAALLAPGVAAAADISGAWKLDVDIAGMMIPVACNFTQTGNTLGGTCARADASETPAAVAGAVDGANASWAYDVTFQDQPLHVEYKGVAGADAKSMTGTISVAGAGEGTFKGAMQ